MFNNKFLLALLYFTEFRYCRSPENHFFQRSHWHFKNNTVDECDYDAHYEMSDVSMKLKVIM